MSYNNLIIYVFFLSYYSFCHTRAAPAQNQTSTNQDDYPDDDYDEYYDDTEYQGKQQAVASPPSSHATATSTAVNLANSLFNLFSGGDKPGNYLKRLQKYLNLTKIVFF